MFFVEAQITGNGANKAAIENAAGKLLPVFIFQGLQKTQADARRYNDFVGRNFAQLALALQTFPKISLGHELDLVGEASAICAVDMKRRGAAADGGAHSRKVWAPLDGTIGGTANRVKQRLGADLCTQENCYTVERDDSGKAQLESSGGAEKAFSMYMELNPIVDYRP
jgi:hypothetical protein